MAKYNIPFSSLCGLLCLLLPACEMVHEVDLPPHTPKLTLRMALEGSDTELQDTYSFANRPFIGRSQGVLDSEELEAVANATVRLFDADGQLVEQYEHAGVDTSEYRQSWGTYRPTQGFRPISGKAYTMRVEAPGFEAIEATTTLPATVSVTDVTLTKLQQNDNGYYNYWDGKLKLTIQDDPAKENFYRVVVHALDSAYHYTSLMAYSTGNRDETGLGESKQDELNRIFSDELYASSSIMFSTDLSLPAFFYSQDGQLYPIEHVAVQVEHLNKDEYLFWKTLDAQGRTAGNPFAEYSNVYSNVKYGYGVLGGKVISRIILDL